MDKTIEQLLASLSPEEKEKLMRLIAGPKSTTPRRGPKPRFIPKPRPSKEVEVEDTYICKLCGNRYTSKHTYLTNETYIVPRIYSLVTCDNCYGFFLEKDRGIAIRALLDYIRKVAK